MCAFGTRLLRSISAANRFSRPSPTTLNAIPCATTGLPLTAYAAGFAVMLGSTDLFWFGVVAAIAACFAVSAIWTVLSSDRPLAVRLFWYLPSILLAAPILWLAFRPEILTIEGIFITDRYAQGTNVNGITWKEEFSEVAVIISNNTAMRFENVTVWLRTDHLIE